MAATLDAGPSASLAMEKRHTGCAQNFSQTSDTACFVESSICGPTNGLPHRAAWIATSPFLNGSEQIPHVFASSCSAIWPPLILMSVAGNVASTRLPHRYLDARAQTNGKFHHSTRSSISGVDARTRPQEAAGALCERRPCPDGGRGENASAGPLSRPQRCGDAPVRCMHLITPDWPHMQCAISSEDV
jgi:hypothetical protein